MNILSNLQQIANIIIRPSRYTYKMTDLGNKSFKLEDKIIQREDFELKNPRGMKIKCSLYTSAKEFKTIEKVIIYLHCNSGCRVEGLAYLKLALQHGFSYLVFDFTGSGLSDGKYVSLGFYQTVDLQCVYLHLRNIISQTAKIVLWGRSMGAVTALNFLLQHKNQIFMAIFDSPFKSLKQLFIQIGRQKTAFPDFILEMAYNYLKPIVQQKAGFDIEKVDLKLENGSITCPGVFIASKQDSLVPFEQIDEIFVNYKGEKEMLFIDESHNQARNANVIKDTFKAIVKQFQKQQLRQKLKLQKKEQQKQKKNFHSVISGGGNDKLERKQLSKKKLQLTIKSLSQRQLLTTTIGKIVLLKDEELLHERRLLPMGKNSVKLTCGGGENMPKLRVRQDTLRASIQKNLSVNNCQQFPCQQTATSYQLLRQIQAPFVLEKKPVSCILSQKKSIKVLCAEEEEQSRYSFQPDSGRKQMQSNKSEAKLKVKMKPFQQGKTFFGGENGVARERQGERADEREITARRQHIQIKVDENKHSQHHPKITLQRHTQGLREKQTDPNIITARQQTHNDPTTITKNFSLIYTKQSPQQNSQLHHTIRLKPININLCSNYSNKQREQPYSQIKTESHNKDIHEVVVKEKEFLKRCESLEKVEKEVVGQTQTYREIKCTERVLEKIIEKQERKMLILNLQQANGGNNNAEVKRTREGEKEKQKQKQKQKTQSLLNKQRKTLQHMANKSKPFVQLKGIKNFRTSFEGKYKTEIRK